MSRISKLVVAGFALSAGLFAAGCQTDNKPAESSLAPSTEGVMCEKCKTTWVKVPVTQSGRISGPVVGYTARSQHTCPDCKTAAENFFTTGKLAHSCKTCGDNLKVCEAH